MCSIGGWLSAAPLPQQEAEDLTRALVYYGTNRGSQSAGAWSNGRTVKRALLPEKFINIRAFRELMSHPTSMVLTHTRQPTCGGVGDQQAQPFTHGDTTTVHNGHVSNIEQMIEKHGLEKASGVDSELFTSFIEKHGILNSPAFFAEMTGSAAVAAVHKGELYLVRTSNPVEYINITTANGTKLLAFASTEGQLINSLRHIYLLPMFLRTITLPVDSLVKCSPTGVEQVADIPSRYKYYGGTGSSSGGYSTVLPASRNWGGRQSSRWDPAKKCLVDVKTCEPIGGDIQDRLWGSD